MTIKDTRTPASTQNASVDSSGSTDGNLEENTGGTPQGEKTAASIGWHKAYVEGSRPDLRVPVRQVHLTNGKSVTLYDTSGPYTDPTVRTDVRRASRRCGRTGSSPGVTPRSTRAVPSGPRTTASSTPRRAEGCAISMRSSPGAPAGRGGVRAGHR